MSAHRRSLNKGDRSTHQNESKSFTRRANLDLIERGPMHRQPIKILIRKSMRFYFLLASIPLFWTSRMNRLRRWLQTLNHSFTLNSKPSHQWLHTFAKPHIKICCSKLFYLNEQILSKEAIN